MAEFLGRLLNRVKQASGSRVELLERYRRVRRASVRLVEPLENEDYQLQSMPECSPPKWHLGHTTWFFETFVLAVAEPDFRPHHPQFGYLFNSYYNALGERWPRSARGLLSRPTVAEVQAYRVAVDERIERVWVKPDAKWAEILELGLNHEEQHQELLLTDLKHAFGLNPLRPTYRAATTESNPPHCAELKWTVFEPGVREIGHAGTGFAFDNESPRHRIFLEGFEMASRPTACGSYLEFMEDGGYSRPELWLSDGWVASRRLGWEAPLYWEKGPNGWQLFTLAGMRPLDLRESVCHVSFYEADAYARWAGARLPTESEWEVAAVGAEREGNFLESGEYHPRASESEQFFGDVWEWTGSPYVAYPGYRPAAGAVGEYNGKFMCNQFVLRGGSCATPAGHIRATYRNFFPPESRWQFSGFRLARDFAR